MFIFILTYTKPLEMVDKHLQAHRAYLDKYYTAGKLLVSGPREQRFGGVIICNVTDREEAEQLMREDPFFINKIADYELVQFDATKYVEPLAPIIAPHNF